MSKMVQIRDLPDEVHRKLKARAAREGMSLSDFIKRELLHSLDRPTASEWLDQLRKLPPVNTEVDSATLIRQLRDHSS